MSGRQGVEEVDDCLGCIRRAVVFLVCRPRCAPPRIPSLSTSRRLHQKPSELRRCRRTRSHSRRRFLGPFEKLMQATDRNRRSRGQEADSGGRGLTGGWSAHDDAKIGCSRYRGEKLRLDPTGRAHQAADSDRRRGLANLLDPPSLTDENQARRYADLSRRGEPGEDLFETLFGSQKPEVHEHHFVRCDSEASTFRGNQYSTRIGHREPNRGYRKARELASDHALCPVGVNDDPGDLVEKGASSREEERVPRSGQAETSSPRNDCARVSMGFHEMRFESIAFATGDLDEQVVQHQVVEDRNGVRTLQPIQETRMMRVVAKVNQRDLIRLRGGVRGDDLDTVSKGPGLGAHASGRGQNSDLGPSPELGKKLYRVVAHPGSRRRQR